MEQRGGRTEQGWHALRGDFQLSRHAADWLTTTMARLEAARNCSDYGSEVTLLMTLAQAEQAVGNISSATNRLQSALTIARDHQLEAEEAAVLADLGTLHYLQGRPHEAKLHLSESAERAGHTEITAGNLGLVLHDLGHLEEARTSLEQAIEISRSLGLRTKEASNLSHLGEVCRDLGEVEAAEDLLVSSVGIARSEAAPHTESESLIRLAGLWTDRPSRLEDAAQYAEAALVFATSTRSRSTEAHAHLALGAVSRRLGTCRKAIGHDQEALNIARSTGYLRVEARALAGVARSYLQLGDLESARRHLVEGLDAAKRRSFRLMESDALVVVSEIEHRRGRGDTATILCCVALDIQRKAKYRQGAREATDLLRALVRD
jgi:tetratricopeptide (TPR) repeat protein